MCVPDPQLIPLIHNKKPLLSTDFVWCVIEISKSGTNIFQFDYVTA